MAVIHLKRIVVAPATSSAAPLTSPAKPPPPRLANGATSALPGPKCHSPPASCDPIALSRCLLGGPNGKPASDDSVFQLKPTSDDDDPKQQLQQQQQGAQSRPTALTCAASSQLISSSPSSAPAFRLAGSSGPLNYVSSSGSLGAPKITQSPPRHAAHDQQAASQRASWKSSTSKLTVGANQPQHSTANGRSTRNTAADASSTAYESAIPSARQVAKASGINQQLLGRRLHQPSAASSTSPATASGRPTYTSSLLSKSSTASQSASRYRTNTSVSRVLTTTTHLRNPSETSAKSTPTAATSNSRLRQGALLARRHSRQLIASGAAQGKLLPESKLSTTSGTTALELVTSVPRRRTSTLLANHLSRSSTTISGAASLARRSRAAADQQQLANARLSQATAAHRTTITSTTRQPISRRAVDSAPNQHHQSGNRFSSGKTRGKISLTSSTSSLSLAVVKRPRASDSLSQARPSASSGGEQGNNYTRQKSSETSPIGIDDKPSAVGMLVAQHQQQQQILRATAAAGPAEGEVAAARRRVSMEEEAQRQQTRAAVSASAAAVGVIVGPTDPPIGQTVRADPATNIDENHLMLARANSTSRILVAHNNGLLFSPPPHSTSHDKENINSDRLFDVCCEDVEIEPQQDNSEKQVQELNLKTPNDEPVLEPQTNAAGEDVKLLSHSETNNHTTSNSLSDEMMVNQERPQLANNNTEVQHKHHILINSVPATPQSHIMTKSAGPVRGQPFGLHQSINIEPAAVVAQQQQQAEQQMSIVDQCLGDLEDNVKTTQQQQHLLPPQAPPSEQQQLALIDIPIKTESICDFYDLETRPFARGKFAQVKRCVSKSSRLCFAAKCIKKRRRLVDIRHEILLEIEALKLSYHTEHIVKLFEVYETNNEMILVLEMARGGELQRVLDDEEFIDEKIVRRMVKQILDGLIYLHDNDIAHLDIKPQNILLTEPFPNGDVKLCDFGISRRITKDCEIREICGTPDYVAPEILRYDPISLATDMWSLGVLTYVLLSGYSPFGSENKQQTFCNITQAALDFPDEIFNKISELAVAFVRQVIVREPAGRLTSRQARLHQWIISDWC